MDLGLTNKVFIVTGATSGLGLASAKELLSEGARVLLTARDESRLNELSSELSRQFPGRVQGLAADNSDPSAAQRIIDTVLDHWQGLDGMLVSVGGPPGGTALDATDDQWQSGFETVFLGAVRLIRAAANAMTEGGAIALVLSSSLRQPIAGLAISNGLRPGLGMIGKTFADELGPRGIRVLNLIPGRIATPRTLAVDAATPNAQERNKAIPLGRLGQPEEFGRVAAFVLSPMASYITGSAITIDGGLIRSM